MLSASTHGQERLKPGRVYYAGDSIYAPVFGVKAVIPSGWIGILPQESWVFTLMTDRGDKDNIFVFGREEELSDILERWKQGIEVVQGVNAKMVSEPDIENDRIYAELVREDDPRKKIIGAAHCGEYGTCITTFALTDDRDLEDIRTSVLEFSNSIHFVEPGVEHIYDNFQWEYYLKGKYIFSYQSNQMYKKENSVWLCPDGTFTSKLKRTGILKTEAEGFKGKKTGTYSISGVGKTGVLTLNFKKLGPVDVEFEIRDDKIFVNGIQQFISDHSMCK